ncbi:MAG: Photosystem assembly protein Ycf3 [Pseudomonadota bacterium]
MNAPSEPIFGPSDDLAKLRLVDLMNRVEALQAQSQLEESSLLYQNWLAVSQDPMRYVVHYNHASLLQSLGRTDKAEKAYLQAIAGNPSFGHAYINLGLMYEKLGLQDKALAQWNTFASMRFISSTLDTEMLCSALNHIGRVQENKKAYDLAERALRESLEIQPEQPGVVQHWVHIRQKACIWPVYQPLPGLNMAKLIRYTSPLGMLAMTEDPAMQLLTSQNFVHRMYGQNFKPVKAKKKMAHGRKRVGMVSADFREHAVGFLLPSFMQGVERSSYELYAYDFTKEERTALRQKFKQSFDHFIDISKLSDEQAAQRMADDGIDILIDLHGLSAGARPGIFARRPAPMQGTYLGFIGPTGMPWFDFVIADRDVLPPDLAIYFTEKPVYMDGSFIPLDRQQVPVPLTDRASLGLPEDAFLMAAFGNVYKITPEMFRVWMNLLHRIDKACLCLIDDNPITVQNLKKAVAQADVDPARVIFLPRSDHPTFCSRLRHFDVFLDTYPYNCGSTTSDVVNAGVPLVTRSGRTMVSRMGLSILREIGEVENAVNTFEDYERKVVEIALRRHAQPARMFSTRVGSLMNQALQRLVQVEPEAAVAVDAQAASARPALQLTRHPLGDAARVSVHSSGLMVPAQVDIHFEQVRGHLLGQQQSHAGFWAFLPDAQLTTCGLDSASLENLLLSQGPHHDMLMFNPFWDTSAFHLNPFLLADLVEPGVLVAAQAFVDTLKIDVRLDHWVSCSDTFLLGLNFVAKRRVWLDWLEMVDKLLRCNDPRVLAHRDVLYALSGNFVLMANAPSVHALDPFDLPSLGSLAPGLLDQAVACDALKASHLRSHQARYLTQFERLAAQALATTSHSPAQLVGGTED